MKDIHGTLRAEDGYLRIGPGEVDVGAHRFRPHNNICAAKSLAQDHSNQGHLRVGVCIDHFGTAADNAGMLLVAARLISRDIHKRNDRDVEGIAEPDKAGNFFRRFNVKAAGTHTRLVGNYPHTASVDAGEPCYHALRKKLMDLNEFTVICNAADHVKHVIRLTIILRDNMAYTFCCKVLRTPFGISIGRRGAFAAGRQIGQERTGIINGIGLVFTQIVCYARCGIMHMPAAKVFHGDMLAGSSFHNLRPCNKHIGILFGHDHNIGECWAIYRTARAGAEDQRYLRYVS